MFPSQAKVRKGYWKESLESLGIITSNAHLIKAVSRVQTTRSIEQTDFIEDEIPSKLKHLSLFQSVRELKSSNPSVAFSHYDSKYKCCCGSVHVKVILLFFKLFNNKYIVARCSAHCLSRHRYLHLWPRLTLCINPIASFVLDFGKSIFLFKSSFNHG